MKRCSSQETPVSCCLIMIVSYFRSLLQSCHSSKLTQSANISSFRGGGTGHFLSFKEKFVFCTSSLIIRIFIRSYTMFYSIIMMNGAVMRAGAYRWKQHRSTCTRTTSRKIQETLFLKDVKLAKCFVVSSHVLTQRNTKLNTDISPKSGSFSCFIKQTNSHLQVIYPCLASCFSVGTREDTTEH